MSANYKDRLCNFLITDKKVLSDEILAFLKEEEKDDVAIEKSVRQMLTDVCDNGFAAVQDYTKKFDNFELLGKFIIEKHRGYSEEILLITSFGTDGTMIACEPVRKGDKSMVSVTVKEVLKIALKHNAPAVIVSHNHMNRNALPSESDILMTMRLSNMLKEINVKLLDHIIVANNDYISMSQSGMYKSIFQL